MHSYFLYQKTFKVTNKKLNELRNEYFIDLAKKKLEETNSKVDEWEEDQKQPLNEYLEKKSKLEVESGKKIEAFKKLNEDANKKYLIALTQYSKYMKGVKEFQKDIDIIATKKLDYDKLITYYTEKINEIDNPKEENKPEDNKDEKDEKEKDDKNEVIDSKEKKKIEKAEKAMIKKKKKEMKSKKAMLVI